MAYALITGGSKGIGKAIAEHLAARKIDVLLVARSEDLLHEVAKQLSNKYGVQTHYLALDLANKEAAKKIFEWISTNNFSVNILINNAGYGLSGSFEKYELPKHLDMMQVNMQVPVELTYLLLPQLKKQSSYIMNIASSAAYQAVPGLSLYAASKAFILSFSRGLNYELKDSSVSITAVSPGATDTDFPVRAEVTSPKAAKLAAKFNMKPEDVARIAVEGMFAKKTEVVTGFINKLSGFFVWLLPKIVVEKGAADIYEL